MVRWLRNNIPNLLTCSNLACGIYSIALLITEKDPPYNLIGVLVVIAGVFDFFDGFVARLLQSTSAIGKDLDSLADLVTFGIVPSMVLFTFSYHQMITAGLNTMYALPCLLVGVFSAIRLAIFNNDTRQSDRFIGVPTPANALFLVFFVMALDAGAYGPYLENSPAISPVIGVVCSIWLVSPITLIALKFKNFTIQDNLDRYLLILVGSVSLLLFKSTAIPFIILLYIVLSIATNRLKRNEF